MCWRRRTMVFTMGITMLVGPGACMKSKRTVQRTLTRSYTISGGIYNHGGVPYCRMRCWSDLRIMKFVHPDERTGKYSIDLTHVEAEALRRFQIIDSGQDTSFFEFDRNLLVDSIISIDFRLRTLLRQYYIERALTDPPRINLSDTIWIDPQGKPVSKPASDSLWRDIPHR